MFFRLRHYRVVAGKLDLFNDFFEARLLPVQMRYGARLVSRLQTDDGKQIFALWIYDSEEHFRAVQSKVAVDPEAISAQEFRKRELDPLFEETEELYLTSTVPMEKTELRHLV